MRSHFDEQLMLLNRELTEMGSLCEEAIAVSTKALLDSDKELAKKAETLEEEIDRMEHNIEALCLKLLLQQQPVARDLRQISAALKMITDMERIGDQAQDIAEIVEYSERFIVNNSDNIKEMAMATIAMVTGSIDAFVKRDLSIAQEVMKRDDIVDEYFDKIKKSLISMIAEKPTDGEYAVDLLMVAKYFERIGDHAVNIAEWVVFSVTGEHKEA